MPPKAKPKKAVSEKARSSKKTNQNTKSEKSEKSEKSTKITEEKLLKIQKAKEARSLDLFYKLSEPEPEEESLEQKIRRNKKELKDNTFM